MDTEDATHPCGEEERPSEPQPLTPVECFSTEVPSDHDGEDTEGCLGWYESTIPSDKTDSGVQPLEAKRQILEERMLIAVTAMKDIEHLEEAVVLVEDMLKERQSRQAALIKQLVFYFSDVNLRRDRFLREKIEDDPSGEGYVPLSLLLPFKRLQSIGCTTVGEIAAAIEAAPKDAGVELSTTKDSVRRTGGAPLPIVNIATADGLPSEQDRRTVQILGFPPSDANVTIEAIAELCSPFGQTGFVRLLRKPSGPFAGSAEVEFQSEESAKKAIAAEPPPTWEGAGLTIKGLMTYRSEWNARKRQLDDDMFAGQESKRVRADGSSACSRVIERGLTLRLDGVPAGMTWKDVRDAVRIFGGVSYVDVQAGSSECSSLCAYVRMKDADGFAKLLSQVSTCGGSFLEIALKAPGASDEMHDTSGKACGSTETPINASPDHMASSNECSSACSLNVGPDESRTEQDANGSSPATAAVAVAAPGDTSVRAAAASPTDDYLVEVQEESTCQKSEQAEDGEGPDAALDMNLQRALAKAMSNDRLKERGAADDQGVDKPENPTCIEQPLSSMDEDGVREKCTESQGVDTTFEEDDKTCKPEAASADQQNAFRVSVTLLVGEEEQQYLQKVAASLADRSSKGAKGGKSGKSSSKGSKGGKNSKRGKGNREKGKGGKAGKNRKDGKGED